MAGKDDDLVAALLQAHGGVDDQSLCPANAQVGVEKDYGLFLESMVLFIVAVVGRHGEKAVLCLFSLVNLNLTHGVCHADDAGEFRVRDETMLARAKL